MKLTPEQFLKYSLDLDKNLNLAKKKVIAVGLPKGSTATKKIYKSGKITVLGIGIIHEYGLGNNPVRSFLRVPFEKEKQKIDKSLTISFYKRANGADVISQLEKNGAYIRNISIASFNNRGYGTWAAIKPETAKRKGSTTILTETGTLKQSITYEVRNASS